jgi:hypothetical protein
LCLAERKRDSAQPQVCGYLLRYRSAANIRLRATDSDEKVISNRPDLRLHVAAKDVGEWTHWNPLVIWREK